jgi:hypothetical protein
MGKRRNYPDQLRNWHHPIQMDRCKRSTWTQQCMCLHLRRFPENMTLTWLFGTDFLRIGADNCSTQMALPIHVQRGKCHRLGSSNNHNSYTWKCDKMQGPMLWCIPLVRGCACSPRLPSIRYPALPPLLCSRRLRVQGPPARTDPAPADRSSACARQPLHRVTAQVAAAGLPPHGARRGRTQGPGGPRQSDRPRPAAGRGRETAARRRQARRPGRRRCGTPDARARLAQAAKRPRVAPRCRAARRPQQGRTGSSTASSVKDGAQTHPLVARTNHQGRGHRRQSCRRCWCCHR